MPSPSPYPSSYPHRHLALTNLLQEQPAGFSTGNDRYQLFNTDLHSQHQRSVALDSILLGGWATSKGRDQDLLHHVDSLRINKNDFQVIGRLGDGQFGTVDAVECKLNGQVYAMKTMPKQAIKRAGIQVCLELERHIHILSHVFPAAPVPTLFVAFQSKDSISLVTEYAACGSLWDRLCSLSDEDDQAGCMTVAEIKWWSPQMVAAIQWMHDQGYVHRDIKPHNFLITDGGRLKLTDFGSSAELSRPRVPSERPFVPHDLCCLPIGTPDYIAPEVLLCAEEAFVQAAGANEASYSPPTFGYDLSIDWWSFGATVFEMATGKGPFWAPTIQQTYFEITQYKGDLQCPLKLDEGLRRLLQSLLQPSNHRVAGLDRLRSVDFFRDVKWDQLGQLSLPSSFDRLEPIDLSSLPPTNDASLRSSDFTFSHFFDQSSSYDSSAVSAMSTISSQEPDLGALSRWIGWTWEPPPSLVKPPPPTDIPSKVKSHPPRPIADFVTPKRSGVSPMYPHERLSTVRRPVPGSHARARPISERQAFSELVDCVQNSAQKQLSARSTNAWSRKSHLSRLTSSIPPTPTPLSRDTSEVVHHTLSKTGDRAPTISDCTDMHLMINDKLHDLHLRLQNIREIMDKNDPTC